MPFEARGVADSSTGGKFWQVKVVGKTLTTTWGKLGDGGNSNTKEFPDEAKAIKEAERLVKSKEKGGYAMEDGDAEAGDRDNSRDDGVKAEDRDNEASSFSARGVADSSTGGKFWEVKVVGKTLTTTWGKLGDLGSSKDKNYNDEAAAVQDAEKLVKAKEKGGYAMEVLGAKDDAKTTAAIGKGGATKKKNKAETKAAAAPAAKKAKNKGVAFSARGVANSASGGKFWMVEVVGCELTTTWGKLGDGGASKTKEYSDEATAVKEAEKLVKSKEKGGYVME